MEYKIIITKRFEDKYFKSLKRYFDLEKFSKIIKLKKHNSISLQVPFEKFKLKINGVDFRGVNFILVGNKIIPLMVYLKKDKKNGMNLTWLENKNQIINEHNFALKDIKENLFKVF